jgi:hypothetical protein
MTTGLPQNLRTLILKATKDIIGKYTFANNQTIPAFAIDDNGKYPPAGTKVEGLEIVIVPCVNSIYRPGLGNTQRWEYVSRVFLKQWNLDGDTIEATELIVPLLGNKVQVSPRILPSESLGNIESRTITFSYFLFKNLRN